MNKGLTSPAAYLFRLGSGTVPDSAVVTIDPLATAKPTENDPAFGPQAVGSRCETCSQDVYHCPGHLGSIKTYPVPVPLAADRLIQWASFICHLCGRIGVSMEERESIRQKRGAFVIKDVQQLLKVKSHDYQCPFCKNPFRVFLPIGFRTALGYDYSTPALFYVDYPNRRGESSITKSGYISLPIADNYYLWSVLSNAAREDMDLFGWMPGAFHPKNFLWNQVPIAPPNARPRPSATAHFIGGKTHKLHDNIAKMQSMIGTTLAGRFLPQAQRDMVGNPAEFNDLIVNIFLLYYAIVLLQTQLPDNLNTFVSNEFKLGTQGGNTSYIGMLGQKHGILRKQMAGIRHDVVIRTPLTSFTYGALGTATCPLEFAMKICVERTVTNANIQLMRTLVRNGPRVYPGANAYKKEGKFLVNITKKDSEAIAASLIPGDVVMRHVNTGDIALHQRYPSIREESINAVMLVVDPGKLVSIPLGVCAKMTADFDGDESELFFPSSYGVAAEALFLMAIPRQFIQPYDGRPCIGIGGDAGTDAVAGIQLLSKRGSFSQREIDALFNETFTTVRPKVKKTEYTFGDIVNAILPLNFYYDAQSCGDNPGGDLRIEGGIVTRGAVTAAGFEVMGNNNAHVTKAIANNVDPYTAMKVLEDMTRLAYRANSMYGWSISGELREREPYKAKIKVLVDERVDEIDQYSQRFHDGKLSIPIGQDPLDYFERVIAFNLTGKNANETSELANQSMKGTALEYYGYIKTFKARIPGALVSRGLATTADHRLRPRLSHNSRHTVWFPKSDDGAKAGGYIASPYLSKLTPPEFFYEAIQARGEVFKRGVSLQEQGYYNRKIGTSLGPIHIGYFGEIRGHGDMILSYTYGQMGSDSHCVIGIIIDDHIISDDEFAKRHSAVPDEYDTLMTIRKDWRMAQEDYGRITSGESLVARLTDFISPIDIHAIIAAYTPKTGTEWTPGVGKPLDRAGVWALLKPVDALLLNAHVGKRIGGFMKRIAMDRVAMFMRLFRFACPSSRLVGWTEENIRAFISAVMLKYAVSLVSPGDMVGLKASLNIAAPQTQAQLHSTRGGTSLTGNAATLRRTHGTARFREVAEGLTPKNPTVSFMLAGVARYSLQACIDYVKSISSVRLFDVLYDSWLVSTDPDNIGHTNDCGFDKLGKYVASLPPAVKKMYETSGQWFYTVLHIEPLRPLNNHVDIAMIGRRLEAQFPQAISHSMSIYENNEGLFVFLAMAADSLELMRSQYDAIIDTGVIHGNAALSNGSVIPFKGLPYYAPDGSMVEKEAYRIVLNGSDIAFLYDEVKIDKSTIISSNVLESKEYFGIEEARFRAFEELIAESHQMDELKGLLYRHVNVMTAYIGYRGELTFVPRSELGKNPDVDDLDKMTFETAKVFLMKSIANERWHKIRGIMPCALFGLPPPFGSSMSAIQIETKAFDQSGDRTVLDELGAKRVKSKDNRPTTTIRRYVTTIPVATAFN